MIGNENERIPLRMNIRKSTNSNHKASQNEQARSKQEPIEKRSLSQWLVKNMANAIFFTLSEVGADAIICLNVHREREIIFSPSGNLETVH